MQTELSGKEADGNAELLTSGTVVADGVKVSTPEDDTLKSVTGFPLKLNVKGIVTTLDQAGVVAGPERIFDHPAGCPPPSGYSKSVLRPFGF